MKILIVTLKKLIGELTIEGPNSPVIFKLYPSIQRMVNITVNYE